MIKSISFQKEFIPLIKQGKKTVTRRINFTSKRGDIFYFKANRNGKKEGYLKIKSAKYQKVFDIWRSYNIDKLNKEGFYKGSWLDQLNDFVELWNRLNIKKEFKYSQDPWIFRIEFKYLGDNLNY